MEDFRSEYQAGLEHYLQSGRIVPELVGNLCRRGASQGLQKIDILNVHQIVVYTIIASCLDKELMQVTSKKSAEFLAVFLAEWDKCEQRDKAFTRTFKECECNFRQLAENVGEVLVLIDIGTYTVNYVNPAYEKIWGRSCESIYRDPKSWLDAIHPDDVAQVEASVATQTEYPRVISQEFRIIRPDGTIRWIWDKMFPIYDADINLTGFAVVSQDITDRKQNEQLLEKIVEQRTAELNILNRKLNAEIRQRTKGEAQLAAILDNTPHLTWLKNNKGRYIAINAAFATACGLAKADIVGKTALDIWPKELALKRMSDDMITIQSAKRSNREMLIHGADGEYWMEMFNSPVFNENGEVIGTTGIAINITERKLAAERLIQSERRYRAIVEDQTELICRYLPDTTLTFVNEHYCRYFGIPAESIIGQKLENFLPAEQQSLILEFVASLSTKKVHTGYEYQFISSNGEKLWTSWTSRPIFNSEGHLIEIQSVGNDITELKQAKEHAEACNAAKTSFLHSTSHELRTPLNAIIGFSEVLYDQFFGPLNDKQREYLTDILESSRHLLSLINDILDLAKIEAGSSMLQIHPVLLGPILGSSIVIIKEKVAENNIQLSVEYPPELSQLPINLDERKIKQVLYNLLSNAVKFTPEGGKIALTTRIENDEVVVCVSDTGIGIAVENQEKLFEPFYQIESGLTAKTPGTGLGLAIAKSIIEMHNGRLWVESEGIPGKGSRFMFALPLARSE